MSRTSSVELRGLEPLTPCMPCRCATSCATAPKSLGNLSCEGLSSLKQPVYLKLHFRFTRIGTPSSGKVPRGHRFRAEAALARNERMLLAVTGAGASLAWRSARVDALVCAGVGAPDTPFAVRGAIGHDSGPLGPESAARPCQSAPGPQSRGETSGARLR